MTKWIAIISSILGLGLGMKLHATSAERPAVSPWVAEFYVHHHILPGFVYKTVGHQDLKLDLYLRSDAPASVPVAFYIHGGAWEHGNRYWEMGYMLAWMELGYDVVSLDYRLSNVARAPAAVEDCFSALHWVARHAGKYHFDLSRLVIVGASAGGNLALLTGMAPPSAGFDHDRLNGPLPRVSAIVSLSGIYDVAALVSGPHSAQFARDWIGTDDAVIRATQVSPLTYVRPGLPPVMMVHGRFDATVPYEQAIRFHAKLVQAGVPNEFLTIPGGHGMWRAEDYEKLYLILDSFLAQHHLKP